MVRSEQKQHKKASREKDVPSCLPHGVVSRVIKPAHLELRSSFAIGADKTCFSWSWMPETSQTIQAITDDRVDADKMHEAHEVYLWHPTSHRNFPAPTQSPSSAMDRARNTALKGMCDFPLTAPARAVCGAGVTLAPAVIRIRTRSRRDTWRISCGMPRHPSLREPR